MKILVTGAKGFIGKNLTAELRNQSYSDIFEYDLDTDPALLDSYCKEAVSDYSVPNVSDKVLRIILSYIDNVNRVVWQSKQNRSGGLRN